jgi:chromosome segregation ATPase
MRVLSVVAALTIAGATAVALAQSSRALIRSSKDRDDRPGFGNSAARHCPQRSQIMSSEERRYEGYQAELAGIEAELGAVQRRLDELKRARDDAKRNVSTSERRYRSVSDSYKRECTENENCDAYDKRADELEQQSKNTQTVLDVIRNEIRTNRDETARLQTRVDAMSREHGEKKCNALVPGETSDAVAQRCLEIFMDWNRAQAELNRGNNRVPDLRSRYEQFLVM